MVPNVGGLAAGGVFEKRPPGHCTGFRGLLNDVGVGEFRDWRAFIMREPHAAANFPLKVARPIFLMGASHYLLFADRDRWTERNN